MSDAFTPSPVPDWLKRAQESTTTTPSPSPPDPASVWLTSTAAEPQIIPPLPPQIQDDDALRDESERVREQMLAIDAAEIPEAAEDDNFNLEDNELTPEQIATDQLAAGLILLKRFWQWPAGTREEGDAADELAELIINSKVLDAFKP